MTAKLRLPAKAASGGVWLNGRQVDAVRDGEAWVVSDAVRGKALAEVR